MPARSRPAWILGAGFVDVLRFGQGVAEGGVKGVGEDALRLLMLLGPLGRAGLACRGGQLHDAVIRRDAEVAEPRERLM